MVTGQFFGAGVVGNPDAAKAHANVFLPALARIGDLALADFEQGSLNGISTISHITEGEEGNRIMKLEWKNVGFEATLQEGETDSWMNYQLWLYEADQSIELRYGPSQLNSEIDVFSGNSGVQAALVCSIPVMIGVVDGVGLVGDPVKPSTANYNWDKEPFLNGIPDSGRVYRWDPNIVSVEENEIITDLNIFPNPMENELNFTSSSVVETIQIVDLTGKMVFESSLQCYSCQVSTKDLSPGLYVVKAKIGDEIISKKIHKS